MHVHQGDVSRYVPDRTVPVQSVHITSKFASLNAADGEVYSIQHYVIEFVSDLRQVFSFLQVPQFPVRHIFNWNIVENGIKDHNNNRNPTKMYLYTPTVNIIQKW